MATAMAAGGNTLTSPIFDIAVLYLGTSSSPTLSDDIPMTYPMQVAQGLSANVIVAT